MFVGLEQTSGGCSKTAGLLVERPSGGSGSGRVPHLLFPWLKGEGFVGRAYEVESCKWHSCNRRVNREKKCIGSEIDTFQYFHFFFCVYAQLK